MKENFLVTQGNDLIEARHNNPLTLREQKIILTMVSMIQPDDEDFTFYDLSIRDFYRLLGLEGREHYTQIKEIVKSLMSKTIELPQDDGGWLMTHWVATAQYLAGKGIIRLKFVPELKPYLLQLKTAFTSYKLSNVLFLKSSYSIRLYELMKKWQLVSRWECSVEDLRLKFGVPKESYPRYGNFKARVLTVAVNEVNEKTDLYISFNEIKKGRRVDRIEFRIRHRPDKEIVLPEPNEDPQDSKEDADLENLRIRLNELAKGYQFDRLYFANMYDTASIIWGQRSELELGYLIKYVNREKSINNPLGFIKSKLKDALELFNSGTTICFSETEQFSKDDNSRSQALQQKSKPETRNIPKSSELSEDPENIEDKRRELLKSLGFTEEEIEAKVSMARHEHLSTK